MEEIRFKIEDTYVHYVKAGTGPKDLVLISGISLGGFEGFGASIAKQYKPLTDDYTLYVFDRRRDVTSKITIADMAEDIYKALLAAGVRHAQFIGFSQGGMISLEMALLHPDMVDGLIIGSSCAGPCEQSQDCGKRWMQWLKAGDIYNFNLEFYHSIYSPEYFGKYQRAFERLAHNGTDAQMKRFALMLDAMEGFDLRPQLKNIKCPCYVIAAEKDMVMGTEPSIEMAAAIGCDHYIYPNGSHAVYDEDKNYVLLLGDILRQR